MTEKTVKDVFSIIFEDEPERAENLRIRAQLMDRIIAIVKTQQQAAKKCHITQPRMNDLLNGKISKFSIDALVAIHTALGERLEISFQKMEQEEIGV